MDILIATYLFACLIVSYALFVWYVKKKHSDSPKHIALLDGHQGTLEESEIDQDFRDYMEQLVMTDRESYRRESSI